MSQPTDFVYRATVISFAPTSGPDYLWSNTHEFTTGAGLLGDEAAVNQVATAFANYHLSLLNAAFGVDRVVISTWGPDLPWPPGFAVVPIRQYGSGPSWGPPSPLSLVAFVRRNVLRGRDGKLFLRGLLSQAAASGEEFRNELRDWINARGDALLTALSNAGVQPVLASGPITAIQTRPITSLRAVNVRTLQYRTRRKTRLQANALDTLANILDGGGITIDEFPQLLNAIRALFPSRQWPQLPPPA